MIRDKHSAPSLPLPPGSTDCHMHVFGSLEDYPCAPNRSYTPQVARLDQWESMAQQIGLTRQVLVQASAYGADNRCMLDAMRQAGARCRGVAVIDDEVSDGELEEMHRIGVRGVRVNAATFGNDDASRILDQIRDTAARIAPLGWHIQIFSRLSVIDALEAELARMPVPLVIDHMGLARGELGVSQPGFASLLRLVGSGKSWVKISGAYRVSSQAPDYADAAPIARALIDANPERIIWGTDWPHTGEHKGAVHHGEPPLIEYRPLDNGKLADLLIGWCGNEAMLKRVLVDNPAALYGFSASYV
jgi:predicted TIM-barrel fold metal-dependent hydrolase